MTAGSTWATARSTLSGVPDYSPGRSAEVVKAQRGLESVAALAANEAAEGPLPGVLELLSGDLSVHRYPQVRSLELQQALAEMHNVPVDCVVVGPGSAGLMWQYSAAFLSSASRVIAPAPSFEGYPLIAALAGATYDPVPLHDQRVDLDAMVAAIDRGPVDLVVIAEPNNPTGTAIGWPGLSRLIEHTRGRCHLIIDEAYVEYNDHPDAVDVIPLLEGHPHVSVFRTFSKAYGLAGLRVGYAVACEEICTYLNRVAPPFSVSSLAQQAAVASVGSVEDLAARVAATIAERQRLIDALREANIDTVDSRANFIFCPMEDPVPVAAELEAYGVITRPFPGVGLRVTVGGKKENDMFLTALVTLSAAQ